MKENSTNNLTDLSCLHFDVYQEDTISIVRLKGNIFDLGTDLSLKERFFSAIRRTNHYRDVKALLIVGDNDSLGEDQFAQFAESIMRDSDAEMMVNREDNAISQFARLVYSIEKLVIVGVSGSVVDRFLGAILAADVRIATARTVFSFPHNRYETPPPAALAHFLPHFVGTARAWKLIMSGKPITAMPALEMGLVDEIVQDDALNHECIQRAKDLVTIPSLALAMAKKSRTLELQGLDLRCAIEGHFRWMSRISQKTRPSQDLHS